MPTNEFLFTNALQIPNLFAQPYEMTLRISFFIFSAMFIVAILHENLEALRGQSDYVGLFVRVILVAGLLVLYERFFVWIVYGMDLLSKAILPEAEFKEVIQTIFHQILDNRDFGVLKFLSIMTAVNFLTYAIALALLGVITWLRIVFLSLLYVVGPILVGAGVYKQTSQGLGFWLRSLVAISSWTVVLSTLMKVISTMNLTAIYLPKETNSASVLAANILFILLFISVPLISQQLTSRTGSLSGLGSAVMGIGTAFVTRTFIQTFKNPSSRGNARQFKGGGAGTPGYK